MYWRRRPSHCSTLYSEDFNPGEVLRGVKLVNPFAQLS
jgi:predicted nucleic acid-binding protein